MPHLDGNLAGTVQPCLLSDQASFRQAQEREAGNERRCNSKCNHLMSLLFGISTQSTDQYSWQSQAGLAGASGETTGGAEWRSVAPALPCQQIFHVMHEFSVCIDLRRLPCLEQQKSNQNRNDRVIAQKCHRQPRMDTSADGAYRSCDQPT